MEELFFTKDSLANKITFYHLLLLMASLPFDRFYSHIILISLVIHTLIQFRKPVRAVFSFRILTLVSVFLITVYSTLYTSAPAGAFNEWGKQALILLIPLLFCFIRLDLKKYRPALLLGFSLICTLTVAWLYLSAFLSVRYYHLPFSALFSYAFTNHNFSAPIAIHATFFSMQLAIAMICLLSVLLKTTSLRYRLFLLFCMGILAAGLIQLSSKSVCLCLLLIVNLAVPYFLLLKGERRRYILITTSLTLAAILVILLLGAFRERFITQLKTDLSTAAAPPGESGDSRLSRWGAVTELIMRSPVIGYGAGTEIPLLKDVFFERRLYSAYLHRLNAHNQYLSLMLKAGIFGLLIYLFTLFAGFRVSLERRDLFLFVFLLLMVFVSLSENLLDVNKGIIFYAFFFSFFIFSGDNPQQLSPPDSAG